MNRIIPLNLRGLLSLSLSLLTAALMAQETGNLEGRITDSNGMPLPEVEVVIPSLDRGANSDEKGTYQLNNLPAGDYEVTASSIGFQDHTDKISIRIGETTALNFRLEASATSLDQVMVRGEGFKKRNQAITVQSVSNADLKRLHLSKMDRVIEQVPGLEVTDYNAGGVANAITMRGFGSGGHGGDIAVQIDGVSLNESEGHADGYADLNMVIPLNLSQVDIYKGPSSVFFGNFANAGAIALTTRKGGEYQDIELQGGSFDTFDGQVAIGNPFELNNGKAIRTNFATQVMKTKGFTHNSDYLKANVNARLAYDLTDKSEIALTLNGHSSRWDSSGYISLDQLNGDLPGYGWKDIAPDGDNDGGDKVYASERLDFGHTFNDNLRLLVYGYALQQSFTRFSSFFGSQSEDFNARKAYSTGFSFNGKNNLGAVDVDWVAGFDFYNEFTDKESWTTKERVRQGAHVEDDNLRIQTTAFFAQGEFDISPYFRPSIGFRYDNFTGNQKDYITGTVVTNKMQGQDHFSPKLGFRSTWFHDFDFRFSTTNGFTLPNGANRFDSNIDIEPVKIWQYEIGFNYDHNWINADIAGYILNSSSEFHEIPPGSRNFVNSGKTERKGIEIGLKLFPVRGLRFDGTFAYVDAKVKDNPEDPSLNGKKVNGIPKTITQLALEYTSPIGLGARYKLRDVGKYAMTAENDLFYGGYTISNVEVFYDFEFAGTKRTRFYAQLKNMFDSRYATSAFSFGTPLVAPAEPRSFVVGVNYNL